MAATPVTATPFSGLPSTATIASTDILPADISGTTSKITAGVLRTKMFAFGGSDPLSIGVLTATGNSTITGTLGGITQLTVSPNGITVTGNSTITGTLSGVTTLTGATGTFTTALILGTTPASGGIIRIPNNTSLLARNAANNADITVIQLINTDVVRLANSQVSINPSTGTLVVGGTITSGGYVSPTVTTGPLSFTPVAAQIVGGATSISLRNNANSADNVLVTDAGVVTIRSSLTVTTGPVNISAGSGLQYAGTTVVGSRKTGWAAQSLGGSKVDMGLTPTTAAVANAVAAIIADLVAHGLIGP